MKAPWVTIPRSYGFVPYQGCRDKGREMRSGDHNNKNQSSGDERSRKAAMYVRMSTDHQKYSTENQADAIREYAR